MVPEQELGVNGAAFGFGPNVATGTGGAGFAAAGDGSELSTGAAGRAEPSSSLNSVGSFCSAAFFSEKECGLVAPDASGLLSFEPGAASEPIGLPTAAGCADTSAAAEGANALVSNVNSNAGAAAAMAMGGGTRRGSKMGRVWLAVSQRERPEVAQGARGHSWWRDAAGQAHKGCALRVRRRD